jgi:ribosomal protein S18 acetylase RimI-like enzyme
VAAASVRAAVPDDAQRIGELHVAAWRRAYRGIMPDALLDGLSVDERVARRRRALEAPHPDTRTFVIAEDRHGLVGFAITGRSRDEPPAAEAELFAIYLDPDRIGHGLGTTLLLHAVDELVARGVDGVSLWVLEANTPARRFYERIGFAADGTVKVFDAGGTPLSEVRYVQRLRG